MIVVGTMRLPQPETLDDLPAFLRGLEPDGGYWLTMRRLADHDHSGGLMGAPVAGGGGGTAEVTITGTEGVTVVESPANTFALGLTASPDANNTVEIRANGIYGTGGGGLTQADADLRYLRLAGGTLVGSLLFSGDGAHDIGGSGVSRPRYVQASGGFAAPFLWNPYGHLRLVPTGNLQAEGPFIFSPDNTYDIGAAAVTRPRTLYLGSSAVIAGKPVAVSPTAGNALTWDGTGFYSTGGAGGTVILDGSGPPAGALGAPGDYYLDTAAGTLYGPKLPGDVTHVYEMPPAATESPGDYTIGLRFVVTAPHVSMKGIHASVGAANTVLTGWKIRLWKASDSSALLSKTVTVVVGEQDLLFDAPLLLTVGEVYVASLWAGPLGHYKQGNIPWTGPGVAGPLRVLSQTDADPADVGSYGAGDTYPAAPWGNVVSTFSPIVVESLPDPWPVALAGVPPGGAVDAELRAYVQQIMAVLDPGGPPPPPP